MSFKELNKTEKAKLVKQYESEFKKSAFDAKKQYVAEFLQYAEKVLSTTEEDEKEINESLPKGEDVEGEGEDQKPVEGEDVEFQEYLQGQYDTMPTLGDNWKNNVECEFLEDEKGEQIVLSKNDTSIRLTKRYDEENEKKRSLLMFVKNGDNRIYIASEKDILRFTSYFSEKVVKAITPAIIAINTALLVNYLGESNFNRNTSLRFTSVEQLSNMIDYFSTMKQHIEFFAKQATIFNTKHGFNEITVKTKSEKAPKKVGFTRKPNAGSKKQ